MNGKRQTIWLVSMLSLMVVLSAYYLFTEDSGVSSPKETAGTIQVDSVKQSGTTDSAASDSGAVVSEVTTQDNAAQDTASAADSGVTDPSGAAAADPNAADPNAAAGTTADDGASAAAADNGSASGDASAKDAKDQASASAPDSSADTNTASAVGTGASAVAEGGVSKDDAAVLDQVASQSASASSMFTNYLYEREQKNLKEQNELMAAINDMDKTPEESAAAQEQLSKLEEKTSKIESIEEQLQQQYGEAIVKEEGDDSYKVVVLSDKLDVKQAVSIVDLVMKELSVSQDKVSVQHVSEE